MKVVAVIPVKGRLPLLKYTIRRLYKKNGVRKVICVGDSIDEKMTCEQEGAEFIKHPNNPLGKKWNAGFLSAKKYQPDACLFVGSSDWISDNWLKVCEPFIMEKKVDLIGKPDFYLLDIGYTFRFCHWHGYGKGVRENEPIGIGRVISRRMLERMNWQPIEDKIDRSIDWSMYQNVLKLKGKVEMITGKEMASLSISTNRWPNMHQFEEHYTNKLPSPRMPGFLDWLEERFPEYKSIFP